jgi:hypothetical protein
MAICAHVLNITKNHKTAIRARKTISFLDGGFCEKKK